MENQKEQKLDVAPQTDNDEIVDKSPKGLLIRFLVGVINVGIPSGILFLILCFVLWVVKFIFDIIDLPTVIPAGVMVGIIATIYGYKYEFNNQIKNHESVTYSQLSGIVFVLGGLTLLAVFVYVTWIILNMTYSHSF